MKIPLARATDRKILLSRLILILRHLLWHSIEFNCRFLSLESNLQSVSILLAFHSSFQQFQQVYIQGSDPRSCFSFSLYTSSISQIFTKASISYHLYADDMQIYISFSPNQSYDSLSVLILHPWQSSCQAHLKSLFPSTHHGLNSSVFSNPQQRNRGIQSSLIVFCGNIICTLNICTKPWSSDLTLISLNTYLQNANLHITRSDSFVRFDHHWIFPLL